jgi:hypothetical protein
MIGIGVLGAILMAVYNKVVTFQKPSSAAA